MKYAIFFLSLILALNACQSDSRPAAKTQQEMGTPPSASRDLAIPPEHLPADTISPDAEVSEPESKKDEPIRQTSTSSSGSGVPSRPSAPMSAKPRSTAPGIGGNSAVAAGFVDIQKLDPSIQLDIRYATSNNFTESKIYDCARCFLRPETAQALSRAQSQLRRQGLSLKVYDCYRPRPYQQRLWDKVPNPDYVTPPEKGSMHSRGAAVDLTIVDAAGQELDMGTPYDFFGPEAHYGYTRLSGKVLSNRRLLRQVLEEVGLKGIRTEWWHFSYTGKSFSLSDWVWDCDDEF